MIKYELLNTIKNKGYQNQRLLQSEIGCSLGRINKELKELVTMGHLTGEYQITEKAEILFKENKVKRAIILGAGEAFRMAPISPNTPKALIEVRGEILVERIIKQLQEVGIYDIYIVVGFLKEKFDYLVDKYQIKTIYNCDYYNTGELYSLKLAEEYLEDSYIISANFYSEKNPFRSSEFYSYYVLQKECDENSGMSSNRQNKLISSKKGLQDGNIAYIKGENIKEIKKKMNDYLETRKNGVNWKECFVDNNIFARFFSNIFTINTYEQLRDYDEYSNHLNNDAIEVIKQIFDVQSNDIKNIQVLKKGMTNRSFTFTIYGKKYIMRIPKEGSFEVVNRFQEEQIYKMIEEYNITDDVLYINHKNGFKISKYIENSRVCDTNKNSDLKKCMELLKKIHQLNLNADHEFNLLEKLNYYESLWKSKNSIYSDYQETKDKILNLIEYINTLKVKKCLCHIDAVSDNFLFDEYDNIYLIDWEYASNQDPHIDIAMFVIYSMLDEKQIDKVIHYYDENCSKEDFIKIYAYIAISGLIWSNWCEYKLGLGTEFGIYSVKQYRYAKDYYKKCKELLKGSYEL